MPISDLAKKLRKSDSAEIDSPRREKQPPRQSHVLVTVQGGKHNLQGKVTKLIRHLSAVPLASAGCFDT
jgi:hypothetical protein